MTIVDERRGLGERPATRRGVLGMLGRGGIVFVGALAGIAATGSAAQANCTCPRACCCLATCTNCVRNGCTFSCPSGWTKTSWGCIAGARPILCGECQIGGNASNCHIKASSYNCSIMIDQNAC
jgi:hypothetical protein